MGSAAQLERAGRRPIAQREQALVGCNPASSRRDITMTTTVLDPTGEATPAERMRNDRLTTLEGRTIGLLDISKPRGNVFLDRIQELLETDGATVRRYAKPTFTKPAPVDLRHEISTSCDAVIEALAD